MKTDNQRARRQRIEAAAYHLLAQQGYKATSMLAIAKEASASNETLYRWYGNKQTLFASLISDNARSVGDVIDDDAQSDPLSTLASIGPKLLAMVTSERVVVLNRAAAADVHDTATLGRTIAKRGRQTVAPQLQALFERARAMGVLQFDDHQDITEIYINLLLGDLQIQRVIGARGPLKRAEIRQRSQRALDLITNLFGVNQSKRRRIKKKAA